MATENKGTGNTLLDDFSLDDGDEFDFASSSGILQDKKKTVVVPKKVEDKQDEDEDENEEGTEGKTVEKGTKAKKKVEKTEDEDEDINFDEEDDDDDKVVKTEKVEGKKADEDAGDKQEGLSFTDLAADLKDKGIFNNVEIAEDKELTEEEFFKMHDDEIESRVTETFEAIFEELGKEGSDFLKYVGNGGNPRTFLAKISNRFNLDELDTDNDAQVNKTLKHYLINFEKIDDEDIDDKMKWLEDSGKKKAYATKYFKIIKETEKEEEAEALALQEQAFKAKQAQVKEFNDTLKEVVGNIKTVGSFNVNKTEQKSLVDYITKPVVKVGKNKYIPEFQAKLRKVLDGKTDKDMEKLAVLAKILKEDFKLEDLETKTTTKVLAKTKSRLASKGSVIKSISSTPKSLADYMDS